MPQLDSTSRDSFGTNQEAVSFKGEWEHERKNRDRFLTQRDKAEVRHSLLNESDMRTIGGSDSERYFQMKWPVMDPQPGSLLSRLASKDAISPFPAHVACVDVCTSRQTYGCSGPTSQNNKVTAVQEPHYNHLLTPLIAYSKEHFSCGLPPSHLPAHVDPETTEIPRQPQISDTIPTYYSFSPEATAQLPHALGWLVSQQSQTVYPMVPGGFNHLYPTALTITTSMSNCAPSRLLPQRLPPSYSFHTAGIPHITITGPCVGLERGSRELANHLIHPHLKDEDEKKNHIKKPLNAFMLYMKEMRAKVASECTLKESAAINQILGRRWHALSREEQGKYYELAKKERQRHMQLYPGWSARDNYGKKKRRKREKLPGQDHGK